MRNRIALAFAALIVAFGVAPVVHADDTPPPVEASCDTALCLPTECREALVELFRAERQLDRAERRIERKNATIKRLRAQLAAQR